MIIDTIIKKALDFIPDQSKRDEAKILFEQGLPLAIKSEVDARLADIKKGGINSFWRPYGAVIIFTSLGIRWIIYPLVKLIVVMGDFDIYLPQTYDFPDAYYHLALAFVSVYGYVRSKYDKKN